MLTSALLELPTAPDATDFVPLDAAFTQLLQHIDPTVTPEVLLAATWLLQALRLGHSCLDLRSVAQRDGAPELKLWLLALRSNRLLITTPDALLPALPLVLEGTRLYLYRYWRYEQQVAQRLNQLAQQRPLLDLALAQQAVQILLPPSLNPEQRLAAVLPLLSGVTLITGGPGTGKTTTVLRLLALLLTLQPQLRIVLAAPTGKAVARLAEALQTQQAQLPPELAARLPLQHCVTVHRLLGINPQDTQPRYQAHRPLPWDVVLVDEASMLDLALTAKLCQALAPASRLILLGDPEQLASVEAGNILGDLTQHGVRYDAERAAQLAQILGTPVTLSLDPSLGLSAASVALHQSYRFDPQRGIGALAYALRRGDGAAVLELLAAGIWPELRWVDSTQTPWEDWLTAVVNAYRPVQQAPDVAAAYVAYQQFRVLCAHRQGERGAEGLNQLLSQRLHRQQHRERWPQGKPLLITANDYARGVFNGDIGLCWPDAEQRSRVYFPAPTGGGLRHLLPTRLSAYEPAYALTVHKSQGSEFDTVALVLPEQTSPVLTRELFYTALTRARQQFWVWGRRELILEAVNRRLRRHSGLAQRLTTAPLEPPPCLDNLTNDSP